MKRCDNCGAELSDEAQYCTQCGMPTGTSTQTFQMPPPPGYQKTRSRYNGMCVAGFAVSLGGIFVLPPLAGILSVIFSAIGLKNLSTNGQLGKGLAVTGILMGIFDMIFGAFLIYFYIYYMRYYGVFPL